MIIIACLIAAFSVILGITCIITRGKRKDWDKRKIVHLPFWLALVGIICGGILSIPTVVCALDNDWMFLFFGIVVLGCDCMMTAYLNCVIWYDDNGFLARNFLGVKRECSYADVEGIRSGRDRRIYFQGHWIMIDEISHGAEEFIDALDRGHKRLTGKWVNASTSYKRKWDPMNGHLDYPWAYLTLWGVMGLFCLSLPVMIFVSMTSETDPSEIVEHKVQFQSYKVEEGSLLLYVDGEEEPFEIGFYRHYGEALPVPEELCDGDWYFVGVEANRYYVKSLTGETGAQYITLESERQTYRESQKGAVWFLCIAAPLGAVFSFFGIAVARNPERYSDRVRRMYYKDGYLH